MVAVSAGAALKTQKFTAARQALALTAVFAALRLVVCAFTGMGVNESYAVASGRLWSLSYFDHPPLHFWLAQAAAMALGDTRWARLPFIALGTGSSWLVFVLTRALYGNRAGLWAALAFSLSLFFSIVAGSWILPDGPLNFFLLAAAVALAPLAKEETLTSRRWAVVGLLVGLAALSKYHALIFAAGAFCFLVSSKESRAVLRTPGPWLALAVAMLVFSPVLVWNAQHDWISFRFQGARAGGHHFGGVLFLSLLAGQIGLLMPWVAWPLVEGVVASRPRRDRAARFLLWLGLPSILFFTLVPLWSDAGMVQWPMPGWLMLFPLAGHLLEIRSHRARWLRGWAYVFAAAFGFVITLGVAEIQTGWLGSAFPHLFRRGDPTAENVEWARLRSVIPIGEANSIILSTGWRDASKVDQALGGAYRIAVLSDDPRNFAIDMNLRDWKRRNGWIVARATAHPSPAALKACFARTHFVSRVVIARGSRPDAVLNVWRGEGFTPQFCHIPK